MTKTVETALTLMLMAAALLDKAGEEIAARKLRDAVDAIGRGTTGKTGPEDQAEGRIGFGTMRRWLASRPSVIE